MNRPRVLVAAILAVLACLTAAPAVLASPVWSIDSLANTTAAPGSTVEYQVQATNTGDEAAPPAPAGDATNCESGGAAPANCYTITGSFPEHLTPLEAKLQGGGVEVISCEVDSVARTFACKVPGDQAKQAVSGESTIGNREVIVRAEVAPGASGTLTPSFSVRGGGALNTATTVRPTIVSSVPPPFGLAAFDDGALGALGGPSTAAAGHPAELSTSLDFNTLQSPNPNLGFAYPVEPTRDVDVELPAGFLGSPSQVDMCTLGRLTNGPAFAPRPLCSPESQVGTATVRLNSGESSFIYKEPLFNMAPGPGVPASFGFDVLGTVVLVDAKVRTGSDYGVTVQVRNASEALPIAGTTVEVWGVPASPSHDHERACEGDIEPPWEGKGGGWCVSKAKPSVFFRNPTRCVSGAEGLVSRAHIDSWVKGGAWTPSGEPDLSDPAWRSASFVSHEGTGYPLPLAEWGATVGIEGCAAVPFEPEISAVPTSEAADSATGLSFQMTVPQDCWSGKASVEEAEAATCQSDLKEAAVTLPAGLSVNPAAASAIGACTQAAFGLHSGLPAHCPDDSKIGTVKIDTPLLGRRDAQGKAVLDGEGNVVPEPLEGSVYLAKQGENEFGSLLAIYLVAEGSGVIVKQAGEVTLDPQTGRLQTVFDEVPQQPFSKLEVKLFGGERGPLRTPGACGSYAATADLTPWSGNPTVQRSSAFQVSQGCGGGGFAPKLSAGTTNATAGQTTPFTLQLTRQDGEQELASIDTVLPPGLAGYLKGVTRCSDAALASVSGQLGSGAAQIASPSCPAGSLLGSVSVAAGAGPDPFHLETGRAYLAGPYQGAPFSLAIVTPAVAGPFDLGSVLVRAGIYVDPSTAQVTVKSGPLPTILQGILLDIRSIEVNVTRPGFMVNPTDCEPLSIGATVASTGGVSVSRSNRFQASGCDKLAFKPRFTASTSATSSRREGASLDVKVAFPAGAEANIAKVKVSLPKQLPSRLDTLKLACTDSVFNANPAGCPAASRIGTATATTPLLDSVLTGPAYIVSHGGAAFPDVEIVLQGEGITLILDGSTDINPKTNVTTSTFATVPDTPVTSFELNLPRGVHSVLGAPGGNLCAQRLAMPTTLTAQDGAILSQSTPVTVSGCKPAIVVLSHRGGRRGVSVTLTVPSAGRLSASGTGLSAVTRRVAHAGNVTLTLALAASERKFLAAHPGRQLRTSVRLTLKPPHGPMLSRSVTVIAG